MEDLADENVVSIHKRDLFTLLEILSVDLINQDSVAEGDFLISQLKILVVSSINFPRGTLSMLFLVLFHC